MGALFALLSAFSYSLVAIFVRRAVSSGVSDSGVLRALFANIVLLGFLFALTRPAGGPVVEVTRAGLLAGAASGFLSGWLAREALYRGIRHIGPGRTSAVKNLNPFVAVLLGVAILGERFSGVAPLGAGVALFGYALLVYEQARRSAASVPAAAPPRGDAGGPVVGSLAGARPPLRGVRHGVRDGMRRLSGSSYLGYVLASLAAVAFGGGQIFRKVAVAEIPDAYLTAFVAAGVSLAAFAVYGAARGTLWRDLRDLGNPRPYYWLAGCAGACGQLFFFLALTYAPVSYVSIIAASDTLLTVAVAAVVFGGTERLTGTLAAAAVAVFTGSVLLALS